jgi:hypothetical protein
MPLKPLIQALAVVWLLLFAAFLTWQLIAFVVAAGVALATRQAVARGVEGIKVIGYGPLALSVFLIGSFIALMAFQIFVMPLFE